MPRTALTHGGPNGLDLVLVERHQVDDAPRRFDPTHPPFPSASDGVWKAVEGCGRYGRIY